MNILCDTCSVLMLIRIAPDMFSDDRYECLTIQEVFRELFRTQKFKSRYPWREKYKPKVKALEKGLGSDQANRYDYNRLNHKIGCFPPLKAPFLPQKHAFKKS